MDVEIIPLPITTSLSLSYCGGWVYRNVVFVLRNGPHGVFRADELYHARITMENYVRDTMDTVRKMRASGKMRTKSGGLSACPSRRDSS